jgi:hypothetical protein
MIIPKMHNHTEERLILSGIKVKNEIASITPAAKDSILYTNKSDGLFITPIKEPIKGPATAISRIIKIVSTMINSSYNKSS